MDLISPIALLAMMQAPAAADALGTSAQWQTEAIERGCEISLRYPGEPAAMVTIRREPTEPTSVVRLDTAAAPVGARTVTLRNEATGEEFKAEAMSGYAERPTKRYLQLRNVDNTFLAKLASAGAVSFSVEGQPVAKLAVVRLDSALPALDACEGILLREWGVDPAPLAQLKTRPQPANEPRAWVTTEDYPPAALKVQEQRDAVLRYRVTSQGRVEGCAIAESSGSIALDRTACQLVTRRARYRPAIAADGSAHEAWVVQTVRWSRM